MLSPLGRATTILNSDKTDLFRSEFLWLTGDRGFLVQGRRSAEGGSKVRGRRSAQGGSKVGDPSKNRGVARAQVRGVCAPRGAAGKKIPAGNEKRIPAGDGDPFSLEGEKIPGSLG